MAVDTLAFVSRGVYDAAGTSQAIVNGRFASWGMLGHGGEPFAEYIHTYPDIAINSIWFRTIILVALISRSICV